MTEAKQITTQAEKIKALWAERTRDKRRIADQQAIIDKQNRELERLKCLKSQAETVFKEW